MTDHSKPPQTATPLKVFWPQAHSKPLGGFVTNSLKSCRLGSRPIFLVIARAQAFSGANKPSSSLSLCPQIMFPGDNEPTASLSLRDCEVPGDENETAFWARRVWDLRFGNVSV